VSALQNSVASAFTYLAIGWDGTDNAELPWQCPAVNAAGVNMTMYVLPSVTAAAHTIWGRWKVNAGTATAFGVGRFLLAIELKR
jgi:hypothetical protein